MFKNILISLLIVIAFLSTWQVIESYISQSRIATGQTAIEAFVPTPITIAKTLIEEGDRIIYETGYTLKRSIVGFLLGCILGITMAVFTYLFPRTRQYTMPLALGINSFPIVGFAPLIILAFGQGSDTSIIFISTLIAYFPIFISLDSAFSMVDKNIIDLMRAFGATRTQIIAKAIAPLSVPYLFDTLKLALPASIIGATMGEWLGTRNGIGHLITVSLYQLKPGLLYASLITITVITLTLSLSISHLKKLAAPWSIDEKN